MTRVRAGLGMYVFEADNGVKEEVVVVLDLERKELGNTPRLLYGSGSGCIPISKTF